MSVVASSSSLSEMKPITSVSSILSGEVLAIPSEILLSLSAATTTVVTPEPQVYVLSPSSIPQVQFFEKTGNSIVPYDGFTKLSTFVKSALRFKLKSSPASATPNSLDSNGNFLEGIDPVVMVFESPSSNSEATSFYNADKFLIHDYPPTPKQYWSVMRPIRYSAVNGSDLPVWIAEAPGSELVDHWKNAIPGFIEPRYISSSEMDLHQYLASSPTTLVHAYLPIAQIPESKHTHDPKVHYEVAGKAAIPLMTSSTTPLLPDTTEPYRPCVVKVTHAMGNLGIFVIQNDANEIEMKNFMIETNNPTYVATGFVDIRRNLATHFFVHPDGSVHFFGYSENLNLADPSETSPRWSSDSSFDFEAQASMQDLLGQYSVDVASYLLTQGYWGFCGIDVLVDGSGKGWVVDVNPRVTGSMPALMLGMTMFKKYGFQFGKFRKSTKWAYPGGKVQLTNDVNKWNLENEHDGRIILMSICENVDDNGGAITQLNIATYAKTEARSLELMGIFCKEMKAGRE